MVVVEIYVLAFPIDKKKKKRVSQDCHPSIWYITEDSFEIRFLW